MTLNGKLYRRAEPVLPTADNAFSLLPTPVSSDAYRGPHWNNRTGATLAHAVIRAELDETWDIYQPAIRHWEIVTSRSAPAAVEVNRNGNLRITVAFVIWMMGWPEDWLAGLSRPNQLKLLGNGVVPRQAALAIDGLGIIVA
jgi:DNA (cytosine-5)-methyltransferase 1